MLQMPQKGHYANKCPEIKAKDIKGSLKARKMDEGITRDDAETKTIRQIRVQFSYLESDQRPIYDILGNSI